uniref:RagB/SusD family nutrient uptake outer membrane protein n=1 Tax=Pedobacter sp. TaxID=1411316 RepID=UPI003D7FC1E6
KYAEVVNGPGRYMIPMIRLSEVLLIAAECHPDQATGMSYLNKLRTARNAVDLVAATPAARLTQIGNEHRREMLGEGQQFFFYKRNSYLNIPNHNTVPGTPDKAMLLNNYIIPLPDSETSQRQ